MMSPVKMETTSTTKAKKRARSLTSIALMVLPLSRNGLEVGPAGLVVSVVLAEDAVAEGAGLVLVGRRVAVISRSCCRLERAALMRGPFVWVEEVLCLCADTFLWLI